MTLNDKFLCHHNITNDPSSKFENEKLPYYVYDTFLKYFMKYIECMFIAYKARSNEEFKANNNIPMLSDPVIYRNILLDIFDNSHVVYSYSAHDENTIQSLTRDEISEFYMEKNIKHVFSNNKFRTCNYLPLLLPNDSNFMCSSGTSHSIIEKEIHDLEHIRNWFIFANNNLIKYTQPMEVIIKPSVGTKVIINGIPDFEFPDYLKKFKYDE